MRKIQQTGVRTISKAAILAFVFCFGLIPVSVFADPPPDARVKVTNCGPKMAFYSFNSDDTWLWTPYDSSCVGQGQAVDLTCATPDGCKVAPYPCGVPYTRYYCKEGDVPETPPAKYVKAVGPATKNPGDGSWSCIYEISKQMYYTTDSNFAGHTCP